MAMPDRQQLLAIYLNNHLAGSSGGRDLFRRAAAGQRKSPRGPELARLADEVDQDRDAQLELMRLLGVSPSRPRALAGRVAETLGRLKPNGTILRRSSLSDVVELEALRVAVAGKVAGWDALLELAQTDRDLPRDRLQGLLARAEDQAERLSRMHREAVHATFA